MSGKKNLIYWKYLPVYYLESHPSFLQVVNEKPSWRA